MSLVKLQQVAFSEGFMSSKCLLNRLSLTNKHMGLDDIYRRSGSCGDKACDHASTQVGTKVIANTSNLHDCLLDLIICCTL